MSERSGNYCTLVKFEAVEKTYYVAHKITVEVGVVLKPAIIDLNGNYRHIENVVPQFLVVFLPSNGIETFDSANVLYYFLAKLCLVDGIDILTFGNGRFLWFAIVVVVGNR